MHSRTTSRTVIRLASLLAGLFAGTALAQDPSADDRGGPVLRPKEFGLDTSFILNVPASSFVPRTSDIGWAYSSPGYIYSTDSSGETFWASVTLPSGVHVSDLTLYYDDTNAGSNISATLRSYGGFTDATANFEDLATATSSGSAGKQIAITTLDHTVDNDTIFSNGMYTIVIFNGAAGSTLKFKGVDLRWNRQLSAAPVMPTFDDVPADDFGYAYIEALAASGITGGCNVAPPQFCPDRTLTRREMAIFLAKALGLHWPR